MTNPHAKAVEAAARAISAIRVGDDGGDWHPAIMPKTKTLVRKDANAAITAYLAAMRAEGWVMVRDDGYTTPETVPWRYGDAWNGVQENATEETLDALCNGYADGWNACRAAMLKGDGDEQG